MNIPRTIEPEWLDSLPPEAPRAIRSRRDLRRINALMANRTIVVRELRRIFPGKPPRSIAEIGAGDGHFMQRIAEKLAPRWSGINVVLLDQQNLMSPATVDRFSAASWAVQAETTDVFTWLEQRSGPIFDVIIANLFLHHFEAPRLVELLSLIARRTRVLIACEPERCGRALFFSHAVGLAGCNDVTRHDAVVSVRAGFRHQELSGAWPAGAAWTLRETAHGLFSHCFVAVRGDDLDCMAEQARHEII